MTQLQYSWPEWLVCLQAAATCSWKCSWLPWWHCMSVKLVKTASSKSFGAEICHEAFLLQLTAEQRLRAWEHVMLPPFKDKEPPLSCCKCTVYNVAFQYPSELWYSSVACYAHDMVSSLSCGLNSKSANSQEQPAYEARHCTSQMMYHVPKHNSRISHFTL